jgi:hypothetical protein
MHAKVNWIGIAAGASTLVLIAISLFVPWWRFTAGIAPLSVEADFSPVNLNFVVMQTTLNIPLIWALNMATMLSLLAGGIIMLIYSVLPAKPYAKKLLGFGYNKPLMAVILFVVELVVLTLIAKQYAGIDFPLMGSTHIQLPSSMTGTATLSAIAIAAFEWPFYFGIAVAALCVAARLYHGKLMRAPPPPSQPQYVSPPPPPMMVEQR